MGWIVLGIKLLPLIVESVQAIERVVTGRKRGKEKEDAAVAMVHAILNTVEVGLDKDLLNDQDVNKATRGVMQAIVMLENVIARRKAAQEGEG